METNCGISVQELEENARVGNTETRMKLAYSYFKGDVVPRDPARAVYWFEQCAAESWDACYTAAMEYRDGKFVPKNLTKMAKCFEIGAVAGIPQAMFYYADCYTKGEGVLPDSEKSLFWLKKAAENGYVIAMDRLAMRYRWGSPSEVNYEDALEWQFKAATSPDAGASEWFFLGDFYACGIGDTKDMDSAIKWWKRAADAGDERAKEELEKYNRATDNSGKRKEQGKKEKKEIKRSEKILIIICIIGSILYIIYEVKTVLNFRIAW